MAMQPTSVLALCAFFLTGCAASRTSSSVAPVGNPERPLYVDVGPMSVSHDGSAAVTGRLRAAMRATAKAAFRDNDQSMNTEWSGQTPPNQAQLVAARTTGVFVDGNAVLLREKGAGRNRSISCEVKLLLATYPDKSMFAFLSGVANMPLSATDGDLARAKEGCVAAVVKRLVESKVIPTLRQRFQ